MMEVGAGEMKPLEGEEVAVTPVVEDDAVEGQEVEETAWDFIMRTPVVSPPILHFKELN